MSAAAVRLVALLLAGLTRYTRNRPLAVVIALLVSGVTKLPPVDSVNALPVALALIVLPLVMVKSPLATAVYVPPAEFAPAIVKAFVSIIFALPLAVSVMVLKSLAALSNVISLPVMVAAPLTLAAALWLMALVLLMVRLPVLIAPNVRALLSLKFTLAAVITLTLPMTFALLVAAIAPLELKVSA